MATKLSLTVDIDSRKLTLELAEGSALVFGRSPTADIHVEESSVSSEHLKIKFTGTKVRIEDLGSSNGTLRLPSEAPFVEAEFSVSGQSLHLRLGFQTEVKLQWQLKADTGRSEMTRTAFDAAGPEPKVTKAEVKAATSVGEVKPERAEKAAASMESAPVSPREVIQKVQKRTSWYFKVFALLVYSAVVLALSKTLWQGDLGFVDQVTREQRGVGLGIDILAVSLAGYAARGYFVASLCILLAYGFYRFWIKHLVNFKLRGIASLWAIVVSTWPLVYPMVLAARNGVTMTHVNALRTSQRLFESSEYTLEEKSKKFAELLPHLQGSSYFYARVVKLFFGQAVGECDGAWRDDWGKKKLCLVLINSVAVQALADIKPKLLNPVALRIVLLTSLDSIIRIFPVEGASGPMNEVFIKSVESVGLKAEGARIRSILASTKASDEEKIESLKKLKISVEMRLDSLEMELHLPEVMRLQAPDVLALGI
ncbi:MAG TPA: FHA domain-containing protein [Bdellovibrionota bacterium]|nr:FHA domain-containing protein [Bdellovibrionota bacterium]